MGLITKVLFIFFFLQCAVYGQSYNPPPCNGRLECESRDIANISQAYIIDPTPVEFVKFDSIRYFPLSESTNNLFSPTNLLLINAKNQNYPTQKDIYISGNGIGFISNASEPDRLKFSKLLELSDENVSYMQIGNIVTDKPNTPVYIVPVDEGYLAKIAFTSQAKHFSTVSGLGVADLNQDSVDDIVMLMDGDIHIEHSCPSEGINQAFCNQTDIDLHQHGIFALELVLQDLNLDLCPEIIVAGREVINSEIRPLVAVLPNINCNLTAEFAEYGAPLIRPLASDSIQSHIKTGDLNRDNISDIVVSLGDSVFVLPGQVTGSNYILPAVDDIVTLPNGENGPISAVDISDIGPAMPRRLAAGGTVRPASGTDGWPDILAVSPGEDGIAVLSIWHNRQASNGAMRFSRQDYSLSEEIKTRDITDLEVGLINADYYPDVVMTDRQQDELLILKSTPDPCVTFVTVPIHGHVGIESTTHAITGTSLPRQTFIDDFIEEVGNRVKRINEARRPGGIIVQSDSEASPGQLPDLCPVRHIELRGHWEDATKAGAVGIVVSRLAWIAAMATPVPFPSTPTFGAISSPDFRVISFWAKTIIFFFDSSSWTRLGLGLIGDITERQTWLASSVVTISVAAEMRDLLSRAVQNARDGMDLCTGTIYTDMQGYSRGGAIAGGILNYLPEIPFNAKLSVTYLDAIDPTPPDNRRPWARAGFMLRDPLIRRIGNETVSNFIAEFPVFAAGGWINDFQAWYGGAIPVIPSEFGLLEDIVGLPLGINRPQFLGGPVGILEVRRLPVTHSSIKGGEEGIGYIHPDNIDRTAPALLAQFPTFNFATTSLLGPYIKQEITGAMNNARSAFLQEAYKEEIGWHPGAPIASEQNEQLPAACLPSPIEEAGQPVSTPPMRNEMLSAPVKARQYVLDNDFTLEGALRRGAEYIISTDILNTIPDNEDGNLFRQVIQKTIKGYPPTTLWRRTKGTPPVVAGMDEFSIRKIAKSLFAADKDLFAGLPSIPDSSGNISESLSKKLDSVRKQLEKRLDLMYKHQQSNPGESRFDDRIKYYTAVSSGITTDADAYMQFGIKQGTIEQYVNPSVKNASSLLLRLDVEFLSENGKIVTGIKGPGLDTEISGTAVSTGVSKRTTLEFYIDNNINPDNSTGPVSLSLTGVDVRVYSVSLTDPRSILKAYNGKWYELMTVEQGMDWSQARAVAERTMYKGKRGRLALVNDIQLMNYLSEAFSLDTYAWIGAYGVANVNGELNFRTTNGDKVNQTLWHPYTKFKSNAEATHFVFMYPKHEGVAIGHNEPGLVRNGLPFAYLIEYK